MDFQSAMETFAEAWVAANSGKLALGASGNGAAGGSSSSPGANATGTPSSGMMAAVSSAMGNPLVGALGVGNSAEQMSLAAAAAAAGSLIQQQLGKGVVVGGNNGGSCSSSNSSLSGGGVVGGCTSAGVVSSSNSGASGLGPSTSSGESALLAAAAACAAASGGSIGPNASIVAGLDYPGKLQSANIGSMPSSVSASVMGSISSGIDLSPPSKRLKAGINSITAAGGTPTAIGNGTLGAISALGVKNKMAHAFQHAHPGLAATGMEVADFVDPAGLLGGQHLSLGKSLPIHCVIEVISGPPIPAGGGRGDRGRDGGGKNETLAVSSGGSNGGGNNGRSSPGNGSSNNIDDVGKIIEVDDFVIIPAGTPFQEVVTTVLTLLGYPKDTIQQAVGMISLKNWKPLRLDQVCDSPHKTVGDILNDLTNHATLRVIVTRAKGGTADDLKEKLLRLLLAQSSSLLLGSGCPLDEVTLSQLMKGQWPQNLAEDVKRRFDQWYATHFQSHRLGSLESLQQQQLHHHHQSQTQPAQTGSQHHSHHHLTALNHSGHQHGHGSTSSNSSRENGGLSSPLSSHHHQHGHLVNGANGAPSLSSVAVAAAAAAAAHHHQSQHLHHHHHELQSGAALATKTFEEDHPNHPVFHGLSTQKTRMRTSFDPEMELPKLQQWFAENPHPSRHQIQQYVRDLNSLDCRKDRKPLDVNNVIYWFKNQRAASKRNELRYNGMAAFPHPLHHHHHHHPNQMSAIHLHNQAHNHAISPIGDDSRDDEREQQQHLHQQHSHHLHHHRVPRSLDSDEPENSHDREDDSEPDRPRDFAHHRNESGSRGSSEDLTAAGKDQVDPDSEEVSGEQSAPTSSSTVRVKRELEDKQRGAAGSPEQEVDSGDLKTADLGEGESENAKKPKIKDEQDDDYISVDVELTEGSNLNANSPGDCCNNNEPKDLSGKSGRADFTNNEDELSVSHHEKNSNSPSPSPAQQQGIGSSGERDEDKKDGLLSRAESRLSPDQHHQQHHHHHNEVSNHSTSSSISPRSSPGLSPSHNYNFSGAPSMVGRFPNFFEHPSFMAYRHFNSFNIGQGFGDSNGNDGGLGVGGPVGYESALSMVAASRAGKGLLAPGKPSPGLDIFHEFQNGLPMLPGGGRGPGSSLSNSGGGAGDPLSRLRGDDLCSSRAVSSADIISSIINSNRGDLGMNPLNLGTHHPNQNSLALDERRKRNRTFIDPVTEVPRLEQWFGLNTHPSHNLILKYTDELNRMPYRQKFPKLEPKNVQFWFKNRRAKCKRLKMTL